MMLDVRRGQLYIADLEPCFGSEQGGIRPVLVIQNDVGNYYSPTTIVAALTTRITRKPLFPTHFLIRSRSGLHKDSIVMLEQIRTIDKNRLITRAGDLSNAEMEVIDKKLKISLSV